MAGDKAAAKHLSYLAVMGVGLLVGAVWGVPQMLRKETTGLLAIGGGPLLAAVVYGIWRGRLRGASTGRSPRQLALCSLLLGCLAWGILYLLDPTPSPADQLGMFGALAFLGALAGGIIAAAMAVTSRFK